MKWGGKKGKSNLYFFWLKRKLNIPIKNHTATWVKLIYSYIFTLHHLKMGNPGYITLILSLKNKFIYLFERERERDRERKRKRKRGEGKG